MQDGAVSSGCSAMPNSRLKTMRDEFLTFIDYYDGFHVNLLFDRFFIDGCAHKWVTANWDKHPEFFGPVFECRTIL